MSLQTLLDKVLQNTEHVQELLDFCAKHDDEPACEALLLAGRRPNPEKLPYQDVYYRPWHDAEEDRVAWERLTTILGDLPQSNELETVLNIVISRGWPDRLRILPGSWLDRFYNGDPDEPWMGLFRALFFSSSNPDLGSLSETVHLSKMTHLTILYGDQGWSSLVPTEHFSALTHIAIDAAPEGRCVDALATVRLPELRHLGLVSCDIELSHLQTIARTKEWRMPETLDFSMNPDCNHNCLTDEAIEFLASDPAFSGIESLSLTSMNGLSDEAIVALSASTNTHKLGRLRIGSESPLGDEAIIALAHSVHLSSLEQLTFTRRSWDVFIEPDEVIALLRTHQPSLLNIEIVE